MISEIRVLSGIFSPNNDAKKDSINFDIIVQDKENIDNWTFSISNKANKIVKTFKGTKDIKDSIKWDGMNDQESVAAEEQYFGQLDVVYINGKNVNLEMIRVGLAEVYQGKPPKGFDRLMKYQISLFFGGARYEISDLRQWFLGVKHNDV